MSSLERQKTFDVITQKRIWNWISYFFLETETCSCKLLLFALGARPIKLLTILMRIDNKTNYHYTIIVHYLAK